MITEISYLVDFITSFIYRANYNIPLSKIKAFKFSFTSLLIRNYSQHWNERDPDKFKRFRSLNFNCYVDYMVLSAWTNVNVNLPSHLANLIFPINLTIYCDPNSVTYKFRGNHYVLYEKKL